jgi:hypothetical protein
MEKLMEEVHISKINIGDTVLHEEKEHTVGKNNLKHCSFMGTTLFGDSYNLGSKPVKRIQF